MKNKITYFPSFICCKSTKHISIQIVLCANMKFTTYTYLFSKFAKIKNIIINILSDIWPSQPTRATKFIKIVLVCRPKPIALLKLIIPISYLLYLTAHDFYIYHLDNKIVTISALETLLPFVHHYDNKKSTDCTKRLLI